MTRGQNDIEALFRELNVTVKGIQSVAHSIAEREGQTTARWQVLEVLETAGLTVPQIASKLQVSRQNVQRIVNGLVADELTALQKNPAHKSSSIVKITPAGVNIMRKLQTARRQAFSSAAELHNVDERQLAATQELLRTVQRITAEIDIKHSTPGA